MFVLPAARFRLAVISANRNKRKSGKQKKNDDRHTKHNEPNKLHSFSYVPTHGRQIIRTIEASRNEIMLI